MSEYFIAFDIFHVIGFVMFGALLFLVAQEAVTNLRFRLQDRRRRRNPDPDLPVPSEGSAGFRLSEPDTALRHLDYHRIPARTVSWTGSHLVGRPPEREELRIGH